MDTTKNELSSENLESVPVSEIDNSQKLSSEENFSPDYELYSKKPKKNYIFNVIGIIVFVLSIGVLAAIYFLR